jgi:hypothetical protein
MTKNKHLDSSFDSFLEEEEDCGRTDWARVDAMKDEDIVIDDDAPELTDDFWENATPWAIRDGQLFGCTKQSGEHWAVALPLIQHWTQGLSKEDAREMAVDLLRSMANDPSLAFRTEWADEYDNGWSTFWIIPESDAATQALNKMVKDVLAQRGSKK